MTMGENNRIFINYYPSWLRPLGAGPHKEAPAFFVYIVRTYIYVDGFNLYYRALKGTAFKWLDLTGMFGAILQPHHNIVKIKYFTARVTKRPNKPSKPRRQNVYLRALQHHCGEVELYFGHFQTHKVQAPLVNPCNGPRFVEIFKTEE